MPKEKAVKKKLPKRVQLADATNPDWDELFDKLWEQGYYSSLLGGSSSGSYCRCAAEKVRMSQAGWYQIKQIIIDEEICVEVINSCSGFSCSLVFYKDREEPFPGAVVKAVPFFQVCSHMLPGDGRSGFKDGWDEFGPLFYSEENIARLKANRLAMPKHASHYDY